MANILVDYESIDYKSYVDVDRIEQILRDNIVKVLSGSKEEVNIATAMSELYSEGVRRMLADHIEPISMEMSTRLYNEFESIMTITNDNLTKELGIDE